MVSSPNPTLGERCHRILASANLSGRPAQVPSFSWNQNGQGLIANETTLHIITPNLGFHPRMSPNLKVDCSSASLESELEHFHSVIEISKDFEDKHLSTRWDAGKDYSSTFPTFVGNRWKQACWSTAGLGPNGSCLIATVNSQLELSIYGSKKDPYRGPWIKFGLVDTSPLTKWTQASFLQARAKGLHLHSHSLTEEDRLQRHLSLSRQVTYAAWARSVPSDQGPTYDTWSSLLLTVTRGGDLIIWDWSKEQFKMNVVTVINISREMLSQIEVEEFDTSSNLATAHVAVVAARDIVVLTLKVGPGKHVELFKNPVQPPPIGSNQVTRMSWVNGKLIYVHPGIINVFNPISGNRRAFVCENEEEDRNPFLPAIAIEKHSSDSVQIILQDSSHYSLPLASLDRSTVEREEGEEVAIHASPPTKTLGYDPMLEEVQKGYEGKQLVLGWDSDKKGYLGWGDAKEDTTDFVAIVRNEGPLASWKYVTQHKSRYTLNLRHTDSLPADPSARSILLMRKALSDECKLATNVRLRYYICHYLLVPQEEREAFLFASFDVLEREAEDLYEFVAKYFQEGSTKRLQEMGRWRAASWFASWASVRKTEGSKVDIFKRLSDSFQHSLMMAQLKNIAEDLLESLPLQDEPMEADERVENPCSLSNGNSEAKEYCRRIAALSYLLHREEPPPSSVDDQDEAEVCLTSGLLRIGARIIDEALGETPEEVFQGWEREISQIHALRLGEKCPACEEPLEIKLEGGLLRQSRCLSGHIWPLCSVTFSTLSGPTAKTCLGCWNKSEFEGQDEEEGNGGGGTRENLSSDRRLLGGPIRSKILESCTLCPYCGNNWILL
ncbi:hypothetical protein IE53DRAFT_408379 [Violaceomyces palustris]|uniref:Uncharacterized protein n=1 Tax=Violaceomyces palustris TaxID=1673888 RepID=A0ACD0P788_9BASI|nr:hypothetical protein IE53DRAFT_408379 [Violaceomyces palustris]